MIPIGTEKNLQEALKLQKRRCEENCIKEALKQYLGREVIDADALLCTAVPSNPWNGSYVLVYDGAQIGVISYVKTDDKFRVEFQPIQKLN
jgi:predicted RNA-binding protein with PUA domain